MKLAADIERRIERLEPQRRQVFETTLNAIAQRLIGNEVAEIARATLAGRAAADATSILMHGREADIACVAEVLSLIHEDPDDLEAWSRLKLFAHYRSIEAESYPESELNDAGLSRSKLEDLREQGRLFAIDLPLRPELLYPRWQFDSELRPKAYLPELLAAARKHDVEGSSLHGLMTNPQAGDPPGTPLVEACDEGRIHLALNTIQTQGEMGG